MMKTQAAWLFVVLLAACESNSPASGPGEIRMRGYNSTDLGAVLVEVRDLAVKANGVVLEVSEPQRAIDLADSGHAWTLGKFAVPSDVERLEVSLTLDDFGGWESETGAGALDVRGAPINFSVQLPMFELSHKATVLIDLERSVVPTGGDRAMMLPVTFVAY